MQRHRAGGCMPHAERQPRKCIAHIDAWVHHRCGMRCGHRGRASLDQQPWRQRLAGTVADGRASRSRVPPDRSWHRSRNDRQRVRCLGESRRSNGQYWRRAGLRMARILIIAYTAYARDGRVKRQAEALTSRGDQVDAICLADGEVGDTHGVTVIGLRLPRYRGASRFNYLRSYINFFSRAAALAVRRSMKAPYDIVIACTMPDLAILSALPCRLFGSKLVLDVHDTMPELYLAKFGGRHGRIGARMLMFQERLTARLPDQVLAVHDLHAERLHQSGVPQRKLVVIANSPDPRIFPVADPERPSNRVRSEVDGGRFSIICHGTISRRLGLDTALAALALLHDRYPLIRLRIIGAGDHLTELKALSRELGIESAISFESPVPIQALAENLATA